MSIKLASWNINSIKARHDHVLKWLQDNAPDILMVQELKGVDFPHESFQKTGYHTQAVTQKAYNGVAIFTKEPVDIILDQLPGDAEDEQARYLEIDYQGLRIINIYLPNGNPVDSDKYDYKLSWMERLYQRLATLRQNSIPFVIGGDFNVIPEDKDCHDPQAWRGDALFRPETHAKWRMLLNLGLTDAFRIHNKSGNNYTFWDYQGGAWPKNHGIRIDHFLTSPAVTDRVISCQIDKEPRSADKASDHTPVILELAE